MFTGPRFVAVDDRPHHLEAIVKTFQELGSPCMGISYDPASPLDSIHFRSVRALFIDMHLLEGIPTTQETKHFALIGALLEDNIHATGGPFVLVIWTQHANLCDQLKDYLNANLDPEKPYARPLAVLCLDKEKFINLETGETQEADLLRDAVEGAIAENPQLAALLSWETDVLGAAGATLAALLELIPPNLRQTHSYPSALDEQLSRLAIAAVGKLNVPADRRAAISRVLGPILVDRIQNQNTDAEIRALWDRAITQDQQNLVDLDAPEAGQVNRMLHLSLRQAETIRASDWGAVADLPEAWKADGEMERRFGFRLNRILGGDFKIEGNDRARCRMCLVRAGAVCDYAQHRTGPIPFFLAVEMPVTVERSQKTQASEWMSPTFVVSAAEGPFVLIVNARYLITLAEGEVQGMQVRYRLREQILMELISHAVQHVTRPGIVAVRSRVLPPA